MEPYPLTFQPIYKERIWGGRALERLFGRSLPAGKIGESWELADIPEGVSAVAAGPAAGTPLTKLVEQWGAKLLGPAAAMPDGRFPLLLKLLDANDILSLQVHPDEQAARRIGGSAATKTECWFVLESREGFIYRGLKPGVTAEQFRQAVEDNQVEPLLVRHEVKPGDFHYLPAGTVHALGAGVVVAEVQTPSDTTYRVTDWGRGREIHLERSMECIHFEPSPAAAPAAEGERLLKTRYFDVYHRRRGAATHDLPAGQCLALMILNGRGRVLAEGCPPTMFQAGSTLLLPAALTGGVLVADEPCQHLEVSLPEAK